MQGFCRMADIGGLGHGNEGQQMVWVERHGKVGCDHVNKCGNYNFFRYLT